MVDETRTDLGLDEDQDTPEVFGTPDPSGRTDLVNYGTSAPPAPSDVAHTAIKGAPVYPGDDTEATRVARAAAFELGPADDTLKGDDALDQGRDRLASLESLKEDFSESPATPATPESPTGSGFTDEEVVDARGPQTAEEAQAAEAARREEFSDIELAEAADRNVAAGVTSEQAAEGEIPNLGPSPERVADEPVAVNFPEAPEETEE